MQLTVDKLDAVMSIVQEQWSPHTILLHNGKILSGAFSFAFYNISDGDHIDVVEPQIEQRNRDKTQKRRLFDFERYRQLYTRIRGDNDDPEQIHESFKSFIDPIFGREVAKIRDRFFERIEGTMRSHRQLLAKFFKRKKDKKSEDEKSDDV